MNFLMSFADFFAKGGPLMWPILLCSVLALAIVLFKTLVRKDIPGRPAFGLMICI